MRSVTTKPYRSMTSVIRDRVRRIPKGKHFTISGLLARFRKQSSDSRIGVALLTVTLSTMARDGELERVERGTYMRIKP